MGTPSRMYFKVATIFILVSPLAVLGQGLAFFRRPSPRLPDWERFPASYDQKVPDYFIDVPYLDYPDFPIGLPPSDKLPMATGQLNYQDMDGNNARTRTKNGGRFLKKFLDWLDNLLGVRGSIHPHV